MAKRIISTIGLWSVTIGVLYAFGIAGAVWIVAIVAVASQHELYTMFEKMGERPFRALGLILGLVMILASYYTNAIFSHGEMQGLDAGIIAVCIVIACIRIMRERDSSNRLETIVYTVFGLVYIPFMLNFEIRVMALPEDPKIGLMLGIWVVAVTKFCDVGALLVGMVIGRTKMAPHASPKKTWEGAVGGVIIAALVGAGLVLVFPNLFPPTLTPLIAALTAVPVASAGIVSDLIESIFKRRAEIKDSGKWIPGIGGAFDLADSLILGAPVAYFLFRAIFS
ncbi:MAG: phosphatidate cytidylyltransferase [Verrucomicrobia bacterium]|nr:MAG: phosphatidate cytidylyltransferase [Verrucomicrobiota bacterium]